MKRILPILLLISACSGNGRVPMSQQTSDHIDERQEWEECDHRIVPGAFAPTIKMPLLFHDSEAALDSLQHRRHIVLFWASWCTDCQAEMPGFLQLQQKYPSLEWINVSLDNEAAKAKEYVREKKLAGLHLFDGRDWRGEACTDYAVPLHGIPYIIYVGEDGRIIWTGGTAADLQEALSNTSQTTR